MLEVRVDDRRRMYWREVVPPYVVRYLLPRLFCRIVRRATVIRELSASLTDFSEGNARATSGVSKTRFVPRRYSFKYFPRTPMPNEDREYSARSSSALPFDINHLFASGHHTCTDDPCFGTSNSMCDHNLAPVFLFPPKLARRDLTGGADLCSLSSSLSLSLSLSCWSVLFFGQVAGLGQTARVQRAHSYRARCASNGTALLPALPPLIPATSPRSTPSPKTSTHSAN